MHSRGQRRPDHARAQAEHVDVVVLDALVRRVGVVRARGADARHLAGRHRHPGARAAHHDGALGAARAHRLGRRARACPGSRPGRSSSCRGRPARARARRPPRARAPSAGSRHGRTRTRPSSALHRLLHRLPVSSAYSCAASSAAPSTPARGPWRASRISHCVPAPGTAYFHATSRAGPSRSSPAADTPPPITTSSGSNIVIALAMPMPSRSPRIRRQRIDASSPSRAPSTTSWPVTPPSRVSRLPRNELGSARAASSASLSSARARGQHLERAGLREHAAVRRRARRSRSSPIDRVPDLRGGAGGAAVQAPVEHQPAADAGADREHHEVRDRHAAVAERLGERGARRVVLDVDRQADALGQQLAQRQVLERDVHARADPAGGELDQRRHADPDRARVGRARLLDRARSAARRAPPGCRARCAAGATRSARRPGAWRTAILVPPTSMPMNWSLIGRPPRGSRYTVSSPAAGARARPARSGSGGVAERPPHRLALVLAGDEEHDVRARR